MAKPFTGVVSANPRFHGLDFEVDEATGAVTEAYLGLSYDIVDESRTVLKREASRLPVPFAQVSPQVQGALQAVWDSIIAPKLEEYA